jgi:amino acid transporter
VSSFLLADHHVNPILDHMLINFSVVGPDYISMMAGEIKNPRRVLPPAFNSTIYRIIFFYLTGALCVGIVSASDDAALLGAIAAGAPGAAKSPYIICKSISPS